MQIRDDIVQYIRTLVRDEVEANDEIERRLDQEGWDGYPQYLGSTFFLAVEHSFKDASRNSDIVRFVADVRADIDDAGPPIDPASAETLIKAVFDPALPLNVDHDQIGKIQTLVVYAILNREDMTDADLDRILAEAKALSES